MMIAMLVGAAQAAPTTYTLDPTKSHLFVVVRNDSSTIGSGLGHDHAISPSTFDGTVTWDPEDLSACDVSIAFAVTSLVVDPPGMRQRAGLGPKGVSDGAKQSIKKNFLKPSQLDADDHPKIRYQSSKCAEGDNGTVDVTGELTIRGVGVDLTVPMLVTADEGTFSAAGRFESTHTAFGFEPFSNLLGALKNQNRLEFVVDVRGMP